MFFKEADQPMNFLKRQTFWYMECVLCVPVNEIEMCSRRDEIEGRYTFLEPVSSIPSVNKYLWRANKIK